MTKRTETVTVTTPHDAEWLEFDDAARPPSPFYKEPKMLVKHAIVMTALREPYNATEVIFMTQPDEETGHRETMRLSPDAWRDMGEPDIVTVTIEPGDALNAKTGALCACCGKPILAEEPECASDGEPVHPGCEDAYEDNVYFREFDDAEI